MTTTTMDQTPSADDICGVCAETRENHGDKRHEFNMDGMLIALKPAPARRNNPPTPRGEGVGNDPVARMVLRLIERMTAKGLLAGDDMLYIFGGVDNAPDRGETKGGTPSD